MEKLTLSDLLKYPNAKILVGKFKCNIIEILLKTNELAVSAYGTIDDSCFISDPFVIPISDCKLVLKDLKDITDEDAIEVAKIYGAIHTPFVTITSESPISKIKKMIMENKRYYYKVADYLCSKNYDIDN